MQCEAYFLNSQISSNNWKKRKSLTKRKIIEKPYQPFPSKVAKAISLDHQYKSCQSAEQKVLRLIKQNEALHQRLHQRDESDAAVMVVMGYLTGYT